jgi:hypothetical protein
MKKQLRFMALALTAAMLALVPAGAGAWGYLRNAGDDDNLPPVVSYTPLPATATPASPTLIVTAIDNQAVSVVNLEYLFDDGTKGLVECAPLDGSQFGCEIDDSFVVSGAVSYFVTAYDAAGNRADQPATTAPNLYTIGAGAFIPRGTYTNLNLGQSRLQNNVAARGQVTLSGVVRTRIYALTMECGSSFAAAGPTAYIAGQLNRDFCQPETFTYHVGAQNAEDLHESPANPLLYSPFTVNVTAVRTPTARLNVTPVTGVLPGVNPLESLTRYWTITETGDLTADLRFQYNAADVVGTESGFQLVKREGGLLSVVLPFTLDTEAHTISTTNVSSFSDWTAARLLGPTASGVSVGGSVRTEAGRPVAGALVTINDLQGQTFKTYADQQGGFRFEGLESGRNYLLEASHRRYHFAPRLIFVGANLDGIDFTATELR